MMKTKRTLRQAILALTAIAFLGFGLAACDNSTGGGGNMVRVLEQSGAPLRQVNSEMGLSLTYGQSDISTMTRASAIEGVAGG